jgi:phosphatidylinositol alpha-mannosyltransferase
VKIALVSPYDFAYPGGVNNHITQLERQFTRMGHEVIVIAPASRPITAFGGRFVAIGRPWPYPSSGSVARISLSPWLARQVRTVLDREKFDIVHLHEPLCPALCATVLHESDGNNVGTFHAVDSRGYTMWWPLTFIYLKRWFPKLEKNIAVSRVAMEFANKHFRGNYTVIPNGVDVDFFSQDVSPVDDFNDGKPNILFVSRLEKRKGLNYLLKAYHRAKREIPDLRLIVVGPGTRWSKKYEKQAGENASSGVIFTGRLPYAELPRYYRTADVVCCPATGKESFGIVLLEAMAAGKPIVASNIKGYADVITDGSEGLLVPPRDDKGLARALVSLLKDRKLRQEMGERGRAKARNYRWENIAGRVLDCYSEVLNRHKQTSGT